MTDPPAPPRPLVTIGIPTYNRAALLKRAITSAQRQSYTNLEIIISNNASSDDTDQVCRCYADQDYRIRYVGHNSNIGPVANFEFVLQQAAGEYFMWLGDDDWLDDAYVGDCVATLQSDGSVSLVSGTPLYYRDGTFSHAGRLLDLSTASPVSRVVRYYLSVTDNGMYYGLMRTAQLQAVRFKSEMGGDWHIIASIAFLGRCTMLETVAVHRELGGATSSYRDIARSLNLSRIQSMFPMSSIAIGAASNVMAAKTIFHSERLPTKILLSAVVSLAVASRPAIHFVKRVHRRLIGVPRTSGTSTSTQSTLGKAATERI
jgi:glycosyltransferase involved in cell wall biosynthesis